MWSPIGNEPDERMRVLDAPHFVATKLTSFRGRGAGDFCDHDLAGFIAVVDGRAELLDEVRSAPDDVRAFVATEIAMLMNDEPGMVDYLQFANRKFTWKTEEVRSESRPCPST